VLNFAAPVAGTSFSRPGAFKGPRPRHTWKRLFVSCSLVYRPTGEATRGIVSPRPPLTAMNFLSGWL
jgi:hypothetical protein